MRRYISSFIAAAVLLICCISYWAVSRVESRDSYNKEKNNDVVIRLDEKDVLSMEFENAEGDFSLIREDGDFLLDGAEEADKNTVFQITSAMLDINGRLIKKNCTDEELEGYGLKNPKAAVTVKHTDGAVTLKLGDETPAGTESYVLRDDGSVFSIYTGGASAIATKKWQFMSLEMMSVPFEELTEICVSGKDTFKAEKREKDVWVITSSDGTELETTKDKVRSELALYSESMTAKRAYDNTSERRAEYGLDDKEGTVTFTDKSGEVTQFDFSITAGGEAAVIKNGGDKIYITIADYFDISNLAHDEN